MDTRRQWAAEVEYKRLLDSGEIEPLTDHWQDIARRFPGAPLVPVPQREPVMHRAMHMIQNGLMPPAEMLLVMADCYMEYLAAHGKKSLESAMLGPPKPRIGTLAKRMANFNVRVEITMGVEFLSAKNRGLSDTRAAEHAQAECERAVGWAPNAEAWLRARRRKRADK